MWVVKNMKKTLCLNLFILSSVVIVGGCQKKPEDDAQKTQQASQAAQAPTKNTNALMVKQVEAAYNLPTCEGEGCPEISIKRLETNDPWVTQFLDQKIKDFSKTQSPDEAKKSTTLQQNIDQFVQAAKQDSAERGAPVPYTMNIEAEYLGEKAGLFLFEIEADFYTGGAHGSALKNYYVLDTQAKKQLQLADIIVAGQKQKLHDLVYQEFVKWIKENDPTTDLKQYEEMWKFQLTDNFTFDKKGLEFQYGQYEIAPYAAGMPAFTVPYAQLSGIIKAEYLK